MFYYRLGEFLCHANRRRLVASGAAGALPSATIYLLSLLWAFVFLGQIDLASSSFFAILHVPILTAEAPILSSLYLRRPECPSSGYEVPYLM